VSVLKDSFTGVDGETYDIGRIYTGLVTVVGLGLEVYCVLMGKPFDFQAYGIGCGTMAGGVGAFLKLKETTEPK
jgi:hypothetical protein